MTKMDTMSAFEGEATTIDKPLTPAEKISQWKRQNHAAYKKACENNCTCTPSRADMLLIQQYEGRGPDSLNQ